MKRKTTRAAAIVATIIVKVGLVVWLLMKTGNLPKL